MSKTTYTIAEIQEAFTAMRRDIDADYAGTEFDSERGKFSIGDVETDLLAYLRGMACWMIHQNEAAQRAYRAVAGIEGGDSGEQCIEDETLYGRQIGDDLAQVALLWE